MSVLYRKDLRGIVLYLKGHSRRRPSAEDDCVSFIEDARLLHPRGNRQPGVWLIHQDTSRAVYFIKTIFPLKVSAPVSRR